jgi:carboxypeptidase Taq
MEEKLQTLKEKLAEIRDLDMAGAVLGWDQFTNMPPGGAEARGRQVGTLARFSQERTIDPALGQLIEDLLPLADSLPYDSLDAALIRVAKHDFDRASRIPPAFVAQMYRHVAKIYQVWVSARANNDFASVRPDLEKTLDLSRQAASYFPEAQHIADPLIDLADAGVTVATIRPLFQELREALVPMIQAIRQQPLADDSCLKQTFPADEQLDFGKMVIRAFGFDFERGRQDMSAHPFTTGFSVGDVRITTRVNPNDFADAFFSTTHEAGHAMYEQGVAAELDGSPLANGTSAGVHESQSRLWENMVSRGKDFWVGMYPRLQERFPAQLANVPLDTFYRAVNKVQSSLIRTDADEVTYNLHVMIRFDLEIDLLEGRLAVRDLPEAWNERYRSDLGIVPPDDRRGCLQDMHWFSGLIGGAFQGYTLGNILSGMFFRQALQANPEIPAQVRAGQFGPLHEWLRANIYRYGRMFSADELVARVTGEAWTIQPYIAYLRQKYGELYEL